MSVPQVYSWGSNMCGQLGHVNIPVTVPQQAKVRCRGGGVKVEGRSSTHHCWPVDRVAVTLNRLVGAGVVVCVLQLSEGLRVWDVSAGQSHSLLLADGDCVQPVLLYCGQQQELRAGQGQRSPSRAESYTVRPTVLPFCSEVCVKGPVWLCSCRSDGGEATLFLCISEPLVY